MSALLAAALVASAATGQPTTDVSGPPVIVDSGAREASSWRAVNDGVMDGLSYRSSCETGGAGWRDVLVPLASFVPAFRGRRPPVAPRLDPAKIRQIGLLIADRQEGDLRLEVEHVSAHGRPGAPDGSTP